MAMNLHTQVEVHVKLDKELQGLDVEEYLFTPDGNITSRFVYCEYYFFFILLLPFFLIALQACLEIIYCFFIYIIWHIERKK